MSTTVNIPHAKATETNPKSAKGVPIATNKATKHSKRMKKRVAVFDFILRLGALGAALAATTVMGTTDQTLPLVTQFFQFRASYDDLPALSFFVIATAIVSAYLFFSLFFSCITICRPRTVGLRLLLLISDTVMIALTSGAAGAATAIVYLAHNGSSTANWLAMCQQFDQFCQQISGAVVASFVAAAILILLVVISALNLRKH